MKLFLILGCFIFLTSFNFSQANVINKKEKSFKPKSKQAPFLSQVGPSGSTTPFSSSDSEPDPSPPIQSGDLTTSPQDELTHKNIQAKLKFWRLQLHYSERKISILFKYAQNKIRQEQIKEKNRVKVLKDAIKAATVIAPQLKHGKASSKDIQKFKQAEAVL